MADNWITRDFADYEQAAGGLGVGEENQVLLGKGGIGDIKVFAHPVEVAAGTAERSHRQALALRQESLERQRN